MESNVGKEGEKERKKERGNDRTEVGEENEAETEYTNGYLSSERKTS